jgi:hypothetical protein
MKRGESVRRLGGALSRLEQGHLAGHPNTISTVARGCSHPQPTLRLQAILTYDDANHGVLPSPGLVRLCIMHMRRFDY